ncbi:MAG: hypothetical protein QW059_06115 [Nitrososphaerota archaeon]
MTEARSSDQELKEKLRELIIDEKELSAALIDRAKRLIRLTRDGKVIFMVPVDRIPVWGRVLLYLVGKRLAREIGLIETDVATIEEISTAIGSDYFSVAARLNELKNQYLVSTVERGGYIVQLAKLQDILERVEKTLTQKSQS